MNYRSRLLRRSFIKEHGLNKMRIDEEIKLLEELLKEVPFESPGVVIAGKNNQEWNYYHAIYLGENQASHSPAIWDRIKMKDTNEYAYIIAIIEEDHATTADGFHGDVGVSE